MQKIDITKKSNGVFEVKISDEDGSKTIHEVTVRSEYVEQLGWSEGATEKLLIKSFDFLLAREPKESILSSFDLSVIAKYFPEYEENIVYKSY